MMMMNQLTNAINVANLKSYAAEFLGSFFFLFASVGVINSIFIANNEYINNVLNTQSSVDVWQAFDPAAILIIAFAFGISIVVLVYALGHISGGHFNPAVTLSMVVFGKCCPFVGLIYTICQMAGSTCGVAMVLLCWPSVATSNTSLGLNSLAPDVTIAGGFFAEFFGTALLVFVVFGTTISNVGCKDVNHMAPFAIGLTVFLGNLVLIPITGCGLNPARSSASAIIAGNGKELWLYWIAPLCGGLCGAAFYYFLFIFKNQEEIKAYDIDIVSGDVENQKNYDKEEEKN